MSRKVGKSVGFLGAFAVDGVGLSGRIGLFWYDVVVDIKSFNIHHIDAVVTTNWGGSPWRFTGFYGEPRRENRHQSWSLLRRLHALLRLPWICMGDFNETLYGLEHYSEHAREEWQMRAFQEATDDCELLDLRFSGAPYTWDNRHEGLANVKARIDRDFGDITLMQMFPIIKFRHIDLVESDHCLVVAELRIHQAPHMRRSARSFRYKDVWQTHADYGKVVKELWEDAQHGLGLSGLMSSLNSIQLGLDKWGATTFGNFKKKMANLRRELDRTKMRSMGRGRHLLRRN
jgi:hypothetical protein